jgi:acetylornithine deacetylase
MACLDALWDDQVRLLQDLVAFPSVRGNTAPIQRHIAAYLNQQGLTVERVSLESEPLQRHKSYAPVDWSYEGLFDVVGRLAGAGGGRSLVLNGHVDVVSAEPVDAWTRPAWQGTVDGDRLYGRGSGDMKAGVSAILTIVRALREADVQLCGDLLVQTVIDEECSGNGTLAALVTGATADAAIVAESTGGRLVKAHPGVLWCQLDVRGPGSHAARADATANAIDNAFVLIDGLREVERDWNRPEVRHPLFRDLRHPVNFNLGTLHAGDWQSNVPQRCEVGLRLACLPDHTIAETEAAIRARIAEVVEANPSLREHRPGIRFMGFHAAPAIYDLDTDIAHTLRRMHEACHGDTLAESVLTATIDNRYFELDFGIPNCCYGPTGGNAHTADEWVDLPSLRDATHVLAAAVVDWCGLAE